MNDYVAQKETAEPLAAVAIANCQTSYDLLRYTKGFAQEHDFNYFSIIRLPNADVEHLSAISIISNWPHELVATYDELGLMNKSPVFQTLRTSTKPFLWSIEELNENREDGLGPDVVDLFTSFNIQRGVYLPTHEPSGQRGAVSFSGSRQLPDEAELMELHYVANLLYERAFAMRVPHSVTEQNLSGRERECLKWTSLGKTSGEIAKILHLSEHTVNHYLSAACQKLSAVNRTHAVSKAIRAGIIE